MSNEIHLPKAEMPPYPKVTKPEALSIMQEGWYDHGHVLDPNLCDLLKNFLLNCHAGLGSDPRVCMVTVWCTEGRPISEVMQRIRKRFRTKKIRRTEPKLFWIAERKEDVPDGETGLHYHLLIGWDRHDTTFQFLKRLFVGMEQQGFFPPSRPGRRAWEVSVSLTTKNPFYRLSRWDELVECYSHFAYICKGDEQKDLPKGQRRYSSTHSLDKLYQPPSQGFKPLPKPPQPKDLYSHLYEYKFTDIRTGEIQMEGDDCPF
jgi:hypothetical protein